MNTRLCAQLATLALVFTLLSASAGICHAQIEALNPLDEEEDDLILMDLFTVNAEEDVGYIAENAISGTRLNMPIKELPLSVDVITEAFIEDTGAIGLKEILKYSAGVETDFSATGDIGVNVIGRNYGGTPVSIRGLLTEDQMRDGFRKIGSTDSVNVARAEIVRGPSALLYGIGTFGGLANIISKRPLPEFRANTNFAYGSHNFKRATLDLGGPLVRNDKWGYDIGYRVTTAFQTAESQVDFYERTHKFINPVLELKPTPTTSIVLDLEIYDWEQTRPVNPQREVVRFGELPDAFIDMDRGISPDESKAFLKLPYEGFAYGGRDTISKGRDKGRMVTIQQNLGRHFAFTGGYYSYSRERDDVRLIEDVAVVDASSLSSIPENYRYLFDPLHPDYLPGMELNGSPSQILRYRWGGGGDRQQRIQVRAELVGNYNFWKTENFMTAGYLYNHIDLAGRNYKLIHVDEATGEADINNSATFYHAVNDYTNKISFHEDMLKYDDLLFYRQDYAGSRVYQDSGYYLIYQGIYWENRVNVVAGYRWDRNDVKSVNSAGEDTNRRDGGASKVETNQVGMTYTPKLELWGNEEPISVYVLRAQASYPFYSQTFADGSSDPTIGTSRELGFKFDIWGGKISGGFALFDIERENVLYETTQSLTGDSSDRHRSVADLTEGFDTKIYFTDIIPGFQTVLSYSYIDYRLTDVLVGALEGLDLSQVNNPDVTQHSLSVWNRYEFADGWLKGLSLGLGVTVKSEREVWEQQRNNLLDRGYVNYTEPVNLDAMIKYKGQAGSVDYSFTVNFFNVLNNEDLLLYTYKEGSRFRISGSVNF